MKRMPVFLILLAAVVLGSRPAPAEAPQCPLPLFRGLAGERELPLPLGLSLVGFTQDHSYDLKKLSATSALDPRIGQVAQMADPALIEVENRVMQIGLKADAWLLPFLNVSALAGYIDGETKADFGLLRSLAGRSGALNPAAGEVLARLDSGLDVEYSGFVYGAGGMLAWGVGPLFASVYGLATWAELDTESSVQAYIVRPIVGVREGKVAVWTGAMYQDAEERHEGAISVPGLGAVRYEVELEEQEPWNFLLGASYAFRPEWSLSLEGGLGKRMQLEAALARRF